MDFSRQIEDCPPYIPQLTKFLYISSASSSGCIMNRGEIALEGTPEEIFTSGETLETFNLSLPRTSGPWGRALRWIRPISKRRVLWQARPQRLFFTLARLLNGLLEADNGKICVLGMDIAEGKNAVEIRNHVGVVFQNPDNQMVAKLRTSGRRRAEPTCGVRRLELLKCNPKAARRRQLHPKRRFWQPRGSF